MGALTSTWNKGKARSDAIDRQIKEESRHRAQQVNILLLGTDPDRSMIMKQMTVQHGLTKDERTRYRSTIYENILHDARALVRAVRDMGIEYADPMNHVRADHILDCPSFVLSPEIAEDIHQIWQDSIIPTVLDRCDESCLGENAEYFFKEILRIASPDYLPSDGDILRARENLSRLQEIHLTFGTRQVSIIDTSRRHSIKKWIHYFEDFHYAIFCVSLSHYDQVLQGGDCQKLADSIPCFESITASRWLTRMPIILFLTNADVFKEKLSKIPMARYFPDYTGGADFDKAIAFVTRKFMQVNRSRFPVHVIRHPASNATTAQSIFEIVKRPIQSHTYPDAGQRTLSVVATLWQGSRVGDKFSRPWELENRV